MPHGGTRRDAYLLGEQDRIVGVSGYAVCPPPVRKEKPRVSAFVGAGIPKILARKPDLVLTFSDLQADIVAELIRHGIAVHAFNQRSVAGILAVIRTPGALVGAGARAETLAGRLEERVAAAHARRRALSIKPRLYFEEWDDPMISGIGRVSELIEIAGGTDVFAELSLRAGAKGRIVTPEQIVAARPDIIVGCWCGKKFVPGKIAARPGFDAVPAVHDRALYETKSAVILQPGPAALTDGLDALVGIIAAWSAQRASGVRPSASAR